MTVADSLPSSIRLDLENVLNSSGSFKSEILVLERNENSDLLPLVLPSNRLFFEQVFDNTGPFWSVFAKSGFGMVPKHGKYLHVIANRLFFLKNMENRFLISPGLDKRFVVEKRDVKRPSGQSFIAPILQKKLLLDDADVKLKPVLNAESLLCAVSFVPEVLSQAVSKIRVAFFVSKIMDSFESERENAWAVFEAHQGELDNPFKTAQKCIESASGLMEYSFWAGLGARLDLSINKPAASVWLSELVQNPSREWIAENRGFWCSNPYDLSLPRFEEKPTVFRAIVPSNSLLAFRDEVKLVCSAYLAVGRKAYVQVGKETGLNDDVFFLFADELDDAGSKESVALIQTRKKEFDLASKIELKTRFFFNGTWSDPRVQKIESLVLEKSARVLAGESLGDPSNASGKALVVKSVKDLEQPLEGRVLVSRSLFPDLVLGFSRVKGVVCETGSSLSHAAIVSREYHLPCIRVSSGIDSIKTGDLLELDGKTGHITVSKG